MVNYVIMLWCILYPVSIKYFLPFILDMDSENPFTNEETSSEDDDSTKKLKTIWVGIANSTDKDLKISTWSYFSIPDSTSGDNQHRTQLLNWIQCSGFKLGLGLGAEVTGGTAEFSVSIV